MFEYCCRVCLETDLYDSFIDLFKTCGDEQVTIADKLKFCCGIEPLQDDELPQIICHACLEELTTAWDLRKRSINTDMLLRVAIKNDGHCQEVMADSSDETDSAKEEEPTPVNEPLEDDGWEEPVPKKVVDQTAVQNTTCVFCDEVFSSWYKKNAHLRAHHPNELFCNVCNKSKRSVLLTAHCLWQHKLGLEPSFLCQICGRVFKVKHGLLIHMQAMHSDSSNFQCDLCGMSTRHKTNLLRHVVRTHLKLLKFRCPHDGCIGVQFTTRQTLNTHLYNHHNVKAPFSCEICEAGFNFESERRLHMPKCSNARLDPGFQDRFEEPFKEYLERKCTICGIEFGSSAKYRRHMKRFHNQKVKGYPCHHEGCGKTFKIRIGLLNHIHTHTGGTFFSCDLCDFKGGSRLIIYRHKRTVHAAAKKTKPEKTKILKIETIPSQVKSD